MEAVCATEGCGKPAGKLKCPQCDKYFCSQECFKGFWAQHKKTHVQQVQKLLDTKETGVDGKISPIILTILTFDTRTFGEICGIHFYWQFASCSTHTASYSTQRNPLAWICGNWYLTLLAIFTANVRFRRAKNRKFFPRRNFHRSKNQRGNRIIEGGL